MKMRFALAALLLTSTSAFAADLAPRAVEPAAPIVAPVYNWTGFYAGLHAGAVFGNAKVTAPGFIGSETFRNTGFIGGVHAGYNQQFDGGFVLGAEGDFDYTSLSKSKNYIGGSDKFESEWQGSIRARAGYAIDNLLPYVTAGVAFGDEKLKATDAVLGSYSSSKTVAGWTAGAGLEYAIDPNWIVRGEVRYTDFGKQNFNFAGERLKVRFDEVTTQLGVSYKF
jgi:outer membrane immunogenic protein